MPGGDGTGPLGMGPMTGRRAGYCAGFGISGFPYQPFSGYGRWGRGLGLGRRFGCGFGRGIGWLGLAAGGALLTRNMLGTASRADERAVLVEQAIAIGEALKGIKQRLSDLERSGE